MKNIIEKLKNKNIKSGFSLLRKANKNFVILNLFQNLKILSEPASIYGEKPLRSEQSPAMLTQSQVRSSHTLLCKSGFSLAETMVVLVIVAILMAAAAPLIAKKMSNDSKRLISTSNDGKTVFVAAGDEQVLRVGSNSKKDLKLKVNGNTEMNGDLKIVNKPESGDAVNMILTADGIKTKPTSGDEKYLFKVDPDTRETNIEIAIPDYSEMKQGTNNPVEVTDNGFVYVSNSLRGFKVQKTPISGATKSSALSKISESTTINLTVFHEQITIDGQTVNIATRLPLFIPVSKGSYFQCTNSNFMIYDGNNPKDINSILTITPNAYYQNKCYFIPLKKAKTTTISEE